MHKRVYDKKLLSITFSNHADCYADTIEDRAIQAMTEDKFIEVVTDIVETELSNYQKLTEGL